MVDEHRMWEGSKVRGVPGERHQAGCIYCQSWGSRFTDRSKAIRQAQKHNAICHPYVVGETAPVSVVAGSVTDHG